MKHLPITRYYLFCPGNGKFLSWNNTPVEFAGAKDFLNKQLAIQAAQATHHTLVIVFALVHP